MTRRPLRAEMIDEVRDAALTFSRPTGPPSRTTIELQIHKVPCDPWWTRWHLILHRETIWDDAAYSLAEREFISSSPWRWILERKRRKLEGEIGTEGAVAV